MPPFVPGSHRLLLAWKPDWWLIPTEAHLAPESSLADPFRRDVLGDVDFLEPVVPVAWFFSATAVAIDFLKRLPHADRMRIRHSIIIHEDTRGVAYPESHLQGLWPYILENPRTRFDVHVGLWTNLTHSVWLESMRHEGLHVGRIMKDRVLRPFVDFLDENMTIFSTSPHTDVINVYIQGHLDESVSAWGMFKHTASLHEALANCDYMAQDREIRLSKITIY
jgi:hypothetical protein